MEILTTAMGVKLQALKNWECKLLGQAFQELLNMMIYCTWYFCFSYAYHRQLIICLEITIFSSVMLYRLLVMFWHLRGTCRLYHQGGWGSFPCLFCPQKCFYEGIVCQQWLRYILFTHQQMHYLLNLERFKIYTNIAPTCFSLGPPSGSLYWAWLKLY
jgi:hypothetical protein